MAWGYQEDEMHFCTYVLVSSVPARRVKTRKGHICVRAEKGEMTSSSSGSDSRASR